jgi:glutathione S-transferase
MESLADNPAFQTYALCSAILALKMFASAVYTAATRARVGGYVNPEDTRFGGEGVQAAEFEKPEVAHALRIQRNDLENIPLFWVIGLLYVLGGASPFGMAVYGWTFTLSRVVHTLVYVQHIQPVRALLWLLGSLCIIGMAVQIIWRAL